jgi:L-Ala-D/L-Glu epimerase
METIAMESPTLGPLSLTVAAQRWPLKVPFHITGHEWKVLDVVYVTLTQDGHIGRAEAAGLYFLKEDVPRMIGQIEALRGRIQASVSRDALRELLPAGGARNAVDCALWDLEAKLAGRPVWELAGLPAPRPLLTTFGCGADSPQNMAKAAVAYTQARAIKLKLTGEPIDAERVAAVRRARPDVWLGVDANQGFTRPHLEDLMPTLIDSRVSLIEQPFPVGREDWLDGFGSPIPCAADESVRDSSDLPALAPRFQVVNIKLDKSGGLTEALAMTRAAHELGLETMVGNMIGTSLAMAPAVLVGQRCKVVDLDGPLFLQADHPHGARYTDGVIVVPERLWGGGS